MQNSNLKHELLLKSEKIYLFLNEVMIIKGKNYKDKLKQPKRARKLN